VKATLPRWHSGGSGHGDDNKRGGGRESSDGAHKQEESNLRRQCNSINEGNATI